MSDLTDRLIAEANTEPEWTSAHKLFTEAADEIDLLTRELAEARDKALEDSAKVAILYSTKPIDGEQVIWWQQSKAAVDIAAAIRALKEKP